jgi:hypothetical protein
MRWDKLNWHLRAVSVYIYIFNFIIDILIGIVGSAEAL